MNENVRLAGELLRCARSIVAWKKFPVDYRMQDMPRRNAVLERISGYVTQLETMETLLESDGSVCQTGMLEALREFEDYVQGNL